MRGALAFSAVFAMLIACGAQSHHAVKYGSGLVTPGFGTINNVTAGDGLTGGGSFGPVTVNVGAGSGVIVSADAVSADTSYVQKRIGGSCVGTNAIQTVNADGSVVCVAAGAGTITGVTAGAGLIGGGSAGTVTLDVGAGNGISVGADAISVLNGAGLIFSTGALTYDPTVIQSRVSGACTAGNAIRTVNSDGSVVCQAAGSGTVTSIATTSPITGGTITSTGTIGLSWTSNLRNQSGSLDLSTNVTMPGTLQVRNVLETVDAQTLASGSVTLTPSSTATIERLTCDGVSGTQINAMATSTDGRELDIEVVSGFCEFNASGSSTTIATPNNDVVYLKGGAFGDDGARAVYDSTLGKWAIVATGKITGVLAGAGLINATGNTSGIITLSLNHPTASCSAGQHVSAIDSSGNATCTADSGPPSDTLEGTLTSGTMPIATAVHTLGNGPISETTIAGLSLLDSGSTYGLSVHSGNFLATNGGEIYDTASLDCGFGTNATATCYLDRHSYQTGNGYYRDLEIDGGKADKLALVHGEGSPYLEIDGHLHGGTGGEGAAPSLASCGTSTLETGSSDLDGAIDWDTQSTTCTLNFGESENIQWCQLTYYDRNAKGNIAQWITAQSAAGITIKQSSASNGTVNYLCGSHS
jgi:hypothetical protein